MRPDQNQVVPERDQRAAEPVDQQAPATGTRGDTRNDSGAHTGTHPGAHPGAPSGPDGGGPRNGSDSGHHTAPTGSHTGSAGSDGGSRSAGEPRERLVPADHAASYGSRWDEVKGMFVDEPRQAVARADALVGEVLDELETLFREQRRQIEQGLDSDEASTEDLRLALRRYRSFFDRLLTI
jgi:hypothetical protein